MKYFSLFGCLPLFLFSFNLRAQSIFPEKIEDEKAVYFQAGQFPIHADGIHDDSDALQKAIDEVERNGKFGIVFIPEGIYKLNKTIYVWKGIRLIGYGENRPVFTRDGDDPDYEAESSRYMIHFVSNKRRNIFIVADNIYVYDAEGNQIEMIEVPERPSSITFGGKGGNTLYISARSSLYGIELSEL